MTERSREEVLSIVTAFQDELKTLGEQFEKLDAMEKVLTQDMLECGRLVNSEPHTDGIARSFVRTVFAMIEGTTFNLKQMALNLSAHGRGNFSKAELAMLEEVVYELGDKGEAVTQTKFMKLPTNIRFAFDAAARAFGVTYKLEVGDSGWAIFKEALIIRNRITHPKIIDDLKLSETEVQKVIDTGAWFLRCRRELFQQFISRMQRLKDILDTPKSASPS
jgi:hypothetical protein